MVNVMHEPFACLVILIESPCGSGVKNLHRKLRKSAVKLTQDQKEAVLKKFYKPQTNRKNLAESEGISRVTLYQWKNTVLGKDFPLRMTLKNQEKQKELLLKEVEDLQKQVHQLQLEKALLEGAAELLKKEKGKKSGKTKRATFKGSRRLTKTSTPITARKSITRRSG